MEVAIKMALRAYCVRNNIGDDKKQLGVLGLNGSYHGDTIGAMDACAEGVYSCEWHDAKGFWFDPPSVGITNGQPAIDLPRGLSALAGEKVAQAPSLSWIYDVEPRLRSSLAETYRTYIQDQLKFLEIRGQKFGALVLEPLVMGAGGMIFVDPLFQRIMIDVVRSQGDGQLSGWKGLPVIFDEVFVGLHRIGMESTGPLLGVHPDISVNAKILTGGLVPLAITLASKSIFEAFWGDDKASALLHGHSYTAHAIGCEVANETMKIMQTLKSSQAWKDARAMWSQDESPKAAWSFWDPGFVYAVSQLPVVKMTMALGTLLVIRLQSDSEAGVSERLDDGVILMSCQVTRPCLHRLLLLPYGNVSPTLTILRTPPLALLLQLITELLARLHTS